MATENEQDGTLTVENAMDVLIVLLYAPGKTGTSEPINGITRLQKLMFLIKSRVALEDLVDQA
ncbi:MAG: hypothetical protein QGG25_13565, partial [Phycisphaerae bacterium]|nr:hypothetical protein [Phycisphaerae bacterium]